METEDITNKDEAQAKKPAQPKIKGKNTKMAMMLLIAFVLTIASGWGGYYWGDKQANDQASQSAAEKDSQISQLEQDKTKLQKELADAKVATPVAAAEAAVAVSCPTETTLANIKAAVQSKNYAALEGSMANPVSIILAASEGLGPRTPAQAVGDMAYLSGGTGTWDFSLPTSEVDSYIAGFYTDYFPTDALIGKSANDYLVSFSFDTDCKISVVFITSSTAGLL